MIKHISTAIFLGFLSLTAFAQNKAIGSWTDYLSYATGTSIATNGKIIYCATTTGYFSYNTTDNSIERKSKVNGLSDVNIKKIEYISKNNKLLLVYDNGGIDLVYGNTIQTLPFIKENNRVTGKNINDVFIQGDTAYLSFDFGIVVLNTSRNEISETYNVVPSNLNKRINAAVINNDTVYAATEKGVYFGKTTNNLLDFRNWNLIPHYKDDNIKSIVEFGGNIYAVVATQKEEDELFQILANNQFSKVNRLPKHQFSSINVIHDNLVYITHDSNYVFNHDFSIAWKFKGSENDRVLDATIVGETIYRINSYSPVRGWDKLGNNTKFLRPAGPASNILFNMAADNGELWTVNGGYNFALNNTFDYIVLNRYHDGGWTNYNIYNTPSLDTAYDAISVYLDPDKKGHAFISTWGKGLFEFKNNLPFINYNGKNSPLSERKSNPGYIGVSSSKYDKNDNLWLVNSHVPNCLVVRKADGSWGSFNFSPEIDAETRMTDIEITNDGVVWVALDRRNEILVFDYNETVNNKNDDRYTILSQQKGKGNIPGIRGVTMALDETGQMWVGTSAGLVVSYSPNRVFEEEFTDLEEILIDAGENTEVLLEGATINSIAIDGANNKWIGTENSGVYQLSPDAKKEKLHFTFDNSPLVSNHIVSIAIDDQNGEVYFGTANGIVSYKSSVIAAKNNFNDLIVYPNPVKANYTGPIGIRGLMEGSTVKITDISGNLVNEFYAEGGQVTWNGRSMDGKKVSSGVYLILASAEDEFGNLSTKSSKVLFLK